MSAPSLFLSVIVPVYQGGQLLPDTLEALARSNLPRRHWELIVVDDASTDGTSAIAAKWADHVVTLEGWPRGPGYARNRGVEVSQGEWVAFVDADVRVHRDTLQQFVEAIESDPGADAVFGAYDDSPPAPGFLSAYRNLLHRHVHLMGAGNAETFWAGCGAVRRSAFVTAGGFDAARYPRPQIEDIEFGYRLRDGGSRIRLRPEITGTHLKRWTFLAALRTDLYDRGIPWVRLLIDRRALARPASLNLRSGERVKVVLVWLALVMGLVALVTWEPIWLVGAGAGLLGVTLASLPLLRWFAEQRGIGFALAVIPFNLIYYLMGGLAVLGGLAGYIRDGRARSRRSSPLRDLPSR